MWFSSGCLRWLGGVYEKGYFVVTIMDNFSSETTGERGDRKIPLLGDAALDRSTPYVDDNCVRTRWVTVQRSKVFDRVSIL